MSKSICDKCVYKTFCNLGIETIIAGCSKFKLKRPFTHADAIRAMSDEELADFIWGAETAGRAYGPRGKKAWLGWLKQEVSDV